MNSDDLPTRSSLIGRLRSDGHDDAWRDFVDRYTPTLVGWCRQIGMRDENDIGDVIQLVLTKLVRGIRTYDARKGPFRAWLRTVVRNAWIDVRRSIEKGRGSGDTNIIDVLAQHADDRSLARCLEQQLEVETVHYAIEQLRRKMPMATEAFALRYVDGLEIDEVADRLNRRKGAVYTLLSRFRIAIKEFLDSSCTE